jgi:hypothetical protein
VWIGIALVVAAVVVVNLLARGLDESIGGGDPTGLPGSSYATTSDGLAAYASLLSDFGHPVSRQRGPLAEADLDPRTTVVVLEPQEGTAEDAAALLRFVSAGGRLVIGGSNPFYLARLRDDPPAWQPGGPTRWQVAASLDAGKRVESAGRGAFTETFGRRDLMTSDGDVLVAEEPVGAGTMVFVADASPFENDFLARADNAAVGIALAGAAGRPVVFAEGVHGYRERSGLSAIPTPWKVALVLVALAALTYVWSRSRRLGPPDRPARTLPPPRAEYVDALSVTLERTRDPQRALEPMRQWARSRIAVSAGLRVDATDDEYEHAATAYGLDDDDRSALRRPANDDESVLALGRAVAHVAAPRRTTE